MLIRDEDVFEYHEKPRPGKLEVVTSKPCFTQRDLSLAYTPGSRARAWRSRTIRMPRTRFTGRGNLVAVVSNGTAVLGLGDIGPLGAKPVMEGKATLFKRFADIDVFDLELNASDPEEVVRIVKALEPTFGGVNLEDIKAPECFYIEERLRGELQIPCSTTISTAPRSSPAPRFSTRWSWPASASMRSAWCLRAPARPGSPAPTCMCVSASGPSISCSSTRWASSTRAAPKDEPLQGSLCRRHARAHARGRRARCRRLRRGRGGRHPDPEMLRTMARDPIVFAMANPDPEIPYEVARATRPDAIMATGRSDYPNQVNNVLGFPFIFRGALDVRARAINDEMKMAATRALAALAREDVPEAVLKAYGIERLAFGPDYLIPKPFDPRVLLRVAPAVADAAIRSGVAQRPIRDLGEYRESLERIMGPSRRVMRMVVHKAQHAEPRRIVFPDGEEPTVVRAARTIADQRIARPVLLGRRPRSRRAWTRPAWIAARSRSSIRSKPIASRTTPTCSIAGGAEGHDAGAGAGARARPIDLRARDGQPRRRRRVRRRNATRRIRRPSDRRFRSWACGRACRACRR